MKCAIIFSCTDIDLCLTRTNFFIDNQVNEVRCKLGSKQRTRFNEILAQLQPQKQDFNETGGKKRKVCYSLWNIKYFQ